MTIQHFIQIEPHSNHVACLGEWNLSNINHIKAEFDKKNLFDKKELVIDGKDITKMDSAGAWLLSTYITQLTNKKINAQLINFNQQYEKLLSLSKDLLSKQTKIPIIRKLTIIQKIGKNSLLQLAECKDFLSFIGELSFESMRLLKNPLKWRCGSVMHIINMTGTNALMIVALLSFMIGIVISYQMGNQLRSYGANIFIVNLLGLSVLREFGPLITAIMIAGRTGSAFTAELGIMKINQEIDALNTMGMSAIALLILPRVVGLLIVMPLLTIWADIFGIIGGMVMAQNMLNITWLDFLHRFSDAIPLSALIIGLGKAPLFALIIAGIGCFQGMKVRGSAESVGTRTTKSVVISIFLIVIVDAFLSVILSHYKL